MAAFLAVAFLVFCAYCAFSESKRTGLFKTFGVYGRVAAYFSLFLPLGIAAFIASFFVQELSIKEAPFMLLVALLGAAPIWWAWRKCPAFLKGKLIVSMLLSGFGVAIKICFFFIGAVWAMTGPKEMVNEDGQPVYLYGNDVYDGSGNLVGHASADHSSYTRV